MMKRLAIAFLLANAPQATSAQEVYLGALGGGLASGYTDEFGGKIGYGGPTVSGVIGTRWDVGSYLLGIEAVGTLSATSAATGNQGFVDTRTGAAGSLEARGTAGVLVTDELSIFAFAGPALYWQRHDPNVAPQNYSGTFAHIGATMGVGSEYALSRLLNARIEAGVGYYSDTTYDIGLGNYRAGVKPAPFIRAGLVMSFP